MTLYEKKHIHIIINSESIHIIMYKEINSKRNTSELMIKASFFFKLLVI